MPAVIETRDADIVGNFGAERGKLAPLPGGTQVQTEAILAGADGTAFRGRRLNAYIMPAASTHTVARLMVGTASEEKWVDFILPASSVAYERRIALALPEQQPLMWRALTGNITVTSYYMED